MGFLLLQPFSEITKCWNATTFSIWHRKLTFVEAGAGFMRLAVGLMPISKAGKTDLLSVKRPNYLKRKTKTIAAWRFEEVVDQNLLLAVSGVSAQQTWRSFAKPAMPVIGLLFRCRCWWKTELSLISISQKYSLYCFHRHHTRRLWAAKIAFVTAFLDNLWQLHVGLFSKTISDADGIKYLVGTRSLFAKATTPEISSRKWLNEL